MTNLTLKQKIIALILVIGAVLIIIFQRGFSPNTPPVNEQVQQTIEVVSTNPSPLEEATILPTQTIGITFNKPLESEGEVKFQIDPKVEFKITVSGDRKTAIFAPVKPLELNQGYTLKILPDTKLEGKQTLGKEVIFHFRTIRYSGV